MLRPRRIGRGGASPRPSSAVKANDRREPAQRDSRIAFDRARSRHRPAQDGRRARRNRAGPCGCRNKRATAFARAKAVQRRETSRGNRTHRSNVGPGRRKLREGGATPSAQAPGITPNFGPVQPPNSRRGAAQQIAQGVLRRTAIGIALSLEDLRADLRTSSE